MPALPSTSVELHHQVAGSGEPIVFVHGSFTDGDAWRFVAPALAEDFMVVTYDRRGHSRSGAGLGPAARRDEEADLVGLIQVLDLGPVHLVGSSYGGSIVLGVAARRPELVRSVVAHEPALGDLVLDPAMQDVKRSMHEVGAQLAAGDLVGGTSRFVDELILGPGWWDRLPEATREVMLANAWTVVDMLEDPAWAQLDTDALAGTGVPVLVTDGDASPGWLRQIAAAVGTLVPDVERLTYAGAGHMPHITHPADLESAVRGWVTRAPVPPRPRGA